MWIPRLPALQRDASSDGLSFLATDCANLRHLPYNQFVGEHRNHGREAILDATSRIIRTQGILGTTISRIVSESGMSAGAIYHHFPNKQAIILAVVDAALELPRTALIQYRTSPSSPQELLAYALYALRADRDLSKLLVQLGAGAAADEPLGHALSERFGQVQEELSTTLRAWAQENSLDPDKVQSYDQLMRGLILGFAVQRYLIESFDEDTYIANSLELMAIETK